MFWEVHPDGQQWSLRRTFGGRLLAGLDWGARAFAGGFAFGLVFFGIEWVGRASAAVDVPPVFVLTVTSFAAFVGFVGFVARMLRYRHWIIDREARTVALSLRRVFADAEVEEVSFDELVRVVVEPRGIGRATRVVLEFRDGAREVLATTRLGPAAFDPVIVGLGRAFRDTGVPVEVGGQPADGDNTQAP